MELVEICEDMSCAIMNELGIDIADFLNLNLVDEPDEEAVFLLNEIHRDNSNLQWWTITLTNVKCIGEQCEL